MIGRIWIITTISLCALLLISCDGNVPTEQEVDYEDIEDLLAENEENMRYTVHGSCDAIPKGSHCLDYVGSYWENAEFARLNCEGEGGGDGKYNSKTCPYTEVGGCRMMEGTLMETVMWAYNYGGSPITPDIAQFEQKGCELNPAGQWVLPEA